MKKEHFIILLAIVTIVAVIVFIFLYDKVYGKIIDVMYIYAYMCLVISFIITAFIYIIFLPIANYLYVKRQEFKYKEKINFEYYRDCIKNYSIGTLCFCYNKKVDYKDQFVATLLKLELDKKIVTTDKSIEVIDKENLSLSERGFINLFTNTQSRHNRTNILRMIKKYSKDDFEMSDLYVKKFALLRTYYLWINVILYFLNFILLINAEKNSTYALMLFGITFGLLVSVILFAKVVSKPYLNKNEKGLEIQYQLIGLKKFLKEYSNIQERKISEIALWDYYIIYGILFDLKGILDDEAKKLYMKYYNLIEKL